MKFRHFSYYHGQMGTTQEILQTIDADCLVELLCACAWAPPGSDDLLMSITRLSLYKKSATWSNNLISMFRHNIDK